MKQEIWDLLAQNPAGNYDEQERLAEKLAALFNEHDQHDTRLLDWLEANNRYAISCTNPAEWEVWDLAEGDTFGAGATVREAIEAAMQKSA